MGEGRWVDDWPWWDGWVKGAGGFGLYCYVLLASALSLLNLVSQT